MTEVAIDAVMTRLIAFARATTTLARVGRREESWKKDRGKKEKKKKGERGNGRKIKAEEEEEKRGVSRVRGARRGHWVRAGHAGRRERSISRWRRAMRARVVVVHADRVDAAWFVAARKS